MMWKRRYGLAYDAEKEFKKWRIASMSLGADRKLHSNTKKAKKPWNTQNGSPSGHEG
jgi:hypothetical protein